MPLLTEELQEEANVTLAPLGGGVTFWGLTGKTGCQADFYEYAPGSNEILAVTEDF